MYFYNKANYNFLYNIKNLVSFFNMLFLNIKITFDY